MAEIMVAIIMPYRKMIALCFESGICSLLVIYKKVSFS